MTQLEIINFLNGFNPSGATLTADQVATLTSQLKSQINQLSAAVPNAASDAITVLYSGTMDGTPARVGRNNHRALRRMQTHSSIPHSAQCAVLIVPYVKRIGIC